MPADARMNPFPPFDDGRARFSRETVGRRTVVAIAGEVDVLSAPAFRHEIEAAMALGGAELWIDLTETDFIDSSGLHALADTHMRMRELGQRLTIICPPGNVRRVMDVSGLSEQLPLASDRPEAHRAG
jgi:anti-sigma B factor antagonist